MKNLRKVLIGISGGVDSSVAAILLKERGYEVEGVTFLFTQDNEFEDAKKVCEKIGIKHHVYDYKKEFKEKIITSFINDYEKGLTPNPCVLCNKTFKIKLLYDKMKELGCDYIATGHYAKIKDGKLFISEDPNKDQTYFLSQIPKEIISTLLLPLDKITKDDVRSIAKKNNLITANKKDSTDVCFIKDGFTKFINENSSNNKEGNIVDVKTKEIIGKHIGLANYTIGQRRGLNIGGTKDRMFVVGKNPKDNILYVESGNDEYLESDSCLVEEINYLDDERLNSMQARFRYKQKNIDVNINWLDNERAIVSYPSKAKAVTPGQVCVFYNENRCLGGGIIKEVRKNNEKLWYL